MYTRWKAIALGSCSGISAGGAFVVQPTPTRPLPAVTIRAQDSRFQAGARLQVCRSQPRTRVLMAIDTDGDEAAPSPLAGNALPAAVAATFVASAAGAAAAFGKPWTAGLRGA